MRQRLIQEEQKMSGDFEEIDIKYQGRNMKGAEARKCFVYPSDMFRTTWDFTITM